MHDVSSQHALGFNWDWDNYVNGVMFSTQGTGLFEENWDEHPKGFVALCDEALNQSIAVNEAICFTMH